MYNKITQVLYLLYVCSILLHTGIIIFHYGYCVLAVGKVGNTSVVCDHVINYTDCYQHTIT
jgi:hypothetical protein